MKRTINTLVKTVGIFAICAALWAPTAWAGFTVGHLDTDPSVIPDNWIARAKSDLHIAYSHTSHGSQIISGMNALRDFPYFGNRYQWSDTSIGDDSELSLDDHGIVNWYDLSQGDNDSGWDDEDGNDLDTWAVYTYNFLNDENNYHINVIMWSWCNIGGHDILRYLNSMEWLIRKFGKNGSQPRAAEHPVQFVFMTGHANGGGEDDSSDSRNKIIRQHCLNHDRILFDFSDIENYDPDGNYFLDKNLQDDLDYNYDNNWALEYLDRHPDEELDKLVYGIDGYYGCPSCAHSGSGGTYKTLNCVLKGRAAWTLYARLAGWQNCLLDFDEDNDHDGLDLAELVTSCDGSCLEEFAAAFGN